MAMLPLWSSSLKAPFSRRTPISGMWRLEGIYDQTGFYIDAGLIVDLDMRLKDGLFQYTCRPRARIEIELPEQLMRIHK